MLDLSLRNNCCTAFNLGNILFKGKIEDIFKIRDIDEHLTHTSIEWHYVVYLWFYRFRFHLLFPEVSLFWLCVFIILAGLVNSTYSGQFICLCLSFLGAIILVLWGLGLVDFHSIHGITEIGENFTPDYLLEHFIVVTCH